ncbi:MAG: hypothetical protein Q4F67_09445 [Propionibacteriaceae bacterium]|nr:hypothetical protein [Propionibacteriaceae bacterium]
MALPPRMSTRGMFWTGVALLALSATLALTADLIPDSLTAIGAWLATALQYLGAAFIAVSIGVRRMVRR